MFNGKFMLKAASLCLLLISQMAVAERVKDVASIAGVRSNMLVGYGLVVGLNKTGDTIQTKFSGQTLRGMLARMGIKIPPGVNPRSKNVAAVTVHADLPAFAKSGQRIDVTVSSIGNAKSLRGGSLLMTPLKAANGQVYALAQGSLIVSGLSSAGRDGSKITVNIPSVGRIPGGGMVEKTVNTPFGESNTLVLNLHSPDFTTANRLAMAINRAIGPSTARPVDGASVKVNAPRDLSQRVSFASMLENIAFEAGDAPARIIVNSRTGTVVINSQVNVKPAAVSHGSLTVTISEETQVSQPNALAAGATTVNPQSTVAVDENGSPMFLFNPGVSLDEIVRAVNQVGAAPSDLVAILEALKSAGALNAELIVI